MWSFFTEAWARQLGVFWSIIIIVGLFVTRWVLVLPSIGMTGQIARWRWLTTLVGVWLLFLFQHLLAVRSGLLSLYAGGLLWLSWLGWHLQRWKTVAVVVMLSLRLGVTCLVILPTIRIRINNTLYDTGQRGTATAANTFSVTARLYSYEITETIISQHPLLGVGKVQLEGAMAQQYSYRYPEIIADRYVLPHNQSLYNLAAYGAIGFVVFLVGFYYPF